MGWVIVPPYPNLLGNTPFKDYPRLATKLLQTEHTGKTLSELTGSSRAKEAHEIVGDFGGAGYEVNGNVGLINLEHVNLATVVHEMGHHKQKHEKNISEENINQVRGVFPLLDLHNILYSENKLAADELRKNPGADPFVRLRYTEKPVRMRVSEWLKASAGHVESEDFKRFKARLQVKGGALWQILVEIENELAAAPNLYPGAVPILFKNLMIKEIRMSNKDIEPTDVAK